MAQIRSKADPSSDAINTNISKALLHSLFVMMRYFMDIKFRPDGARLPKSYEEGQTSS